MKIVFVLFIFILGVVACGDPIHIHPRENPAPVGLSEAERLAELPLSFATVNSRVIHPKCVGCHGESEMVSLVDYKGVASDMTGIKATVFGTGRPMPPPNKAQLSACEKTLLKMWVEAGAPENSELLVGLIPDCQSGRQ